jgi:hypothetical protein
MAYDVGDGVRFKCSFKDLDDAAADPTTVTALIKDPSGNVETLVYGVDAAVIKSATGIYYVDRTIDEAGIWRHRWTGTGALTVAEESSVSVRTQLVS